MKKLLTGLLMLLLFAGPVHLSHAQAYEIQQLALNIQKLAQLRKVLRQIYQAYDIIRNGYQKVKNVTSGNYSLHQVFLDGLYEINPNIRNYKKVAEIVSRQAQILSEYKKAFNRFKQSGKFRPKEISYISEVYSNLFNESLQHLDELVIVLTKSDMRMSDDERIKAIDRLYDDMTDNLKSLRGFNRKTDAVMQQRMKQQQELESLLQLYQVNP